jgi:hypothetical protein
MMIPRRTIWDYVWLWIAMIFVRIAWWLPGRPHRWACKLMQERAAMQQAEKAIKYRRR